ncbi:putative LRR receptor-like serine/threonine-protein kinase MEE39 [Acorus calamus]|uniref:LRR receptor-like serine/threonine-protein kinase MEE39 n=1 Tax=Acorus calamus TaxID=4465 RepID=A0AAV9CK27_ACOCL|nr:putative LRR receptor-like serine/threonine-protein kinase MEE39 [Acorus calamus]
MIQTLSVKGFISIDCGIARNGGYTDDTYKITYTSDDEFIDTGVNAKITPASMSANNPRKLYVTLRSFPNGTRNCYNLSPSGGAKGKKYLIRASFMYGNYDGLNEIPQFDLHVGVNRWTTVVLPNASSSIYYETVHVPRTTNMSVCLIDTGGGVPFISGLELRPLDGESYMGATQGSSLVKYLRYNCGGQDFIRFPDDTLDRIWRSYYNQTTQNPISTTSNVDKNNHFKLPYAVMSTAVTPSTGDALKFDWQASVIGSKDGQHIYMHFMELQQLKTNESRKFGIEINGQSFYKPFQPDYLSVSTIFSINPLNGSTYNVSIQKTNDSTLPPILNAVEVYFVRPMQISPTDDQDVEAITNIKMTYSIKKKKWNGGDPCFPREYSWDGLNCSIDDSINPPRIISLNISNNQLSGSIPLALLKKMNNQELSLRAMAVREGETEREASVTRE